MREKKTAQGWRELKYKAFDAVCAHSIQTRTHTLACTQSIVKWEQHARCRKEGDKAIDKE